MANLRPVLTDDLLGKADVREQDVAWRAYADAKQELDEGYTFAARERARLAFNKFASKLCPGAHSMLEIPSDSKWGMPE